jgi:hypothetical protein
LEEFDRDAVEWLLVGGYAVAFHGRPRATKDIDLLLRGGADNLERAARAAARFGAPPNVVAALRVMAPTDVVFMGQPPLRVVERRTRCSPTDRAPRPSPWRDAERRYGVPKDSTGPTSCGQVRSRGIKKRGVACSTVSHRCQTSRSVAVADLPSFVGEREVASRSSAHERS